MAIFRMIQTKFWNVPVMEVMFFLMYLLINPRLTQCRIYWITKKQEAFEASFSVETSQIERLLNPHELICFSEETREVAIKNWGKHNLDCGGRPRLACIRMKLESVKDQPIIENVGQAVANDSLCIRLP